MDTDKITKTLDAHKDDLAEYYAAIDAEMKNIKQLKGKSIIRDRKYKRRWRRSAILHSFFSTLRAK